ncbi:MAG TPA: DUF1786 domain-containing protein [Chloroflexota bacterium]|jgi:uncharacterized protein (DUF1786 family)|nr:DUF1786 domain-containing protein [Chloroflexota bacterium]
MRILCVDVGTGTQDVLLWDSAETLENCPQLVLPSPTVIVAKAIRAATAAREPVLLTGVIQGGGPCMWAAEAHLRAGLPVYATPEAARTFDDELAKVEQLGVRLVSDDEAAALRGVRRIVLRDLYFDRLLDTLAAFGAPTALDAVAVAVFDHGHAPPGVSDRAFRFAYIARTVHAPQGLAAFAFFRDAIPPQLTRMAAVAASLDPALPLLVMDTGPAAVLGALEDPAVRELSSALIVNVGNFHTLAFHLVAGRVAGLFEHHTGELTQAELEQYLDRLGAGTLTHDEVFADMGHGALIADPAAPPPTRVVVIGPRRALLAGSRLAPYLAVPHGAMMLAGCYGLLRAYAAHAPAAAPLIEASLGPAYQPAA